LVFRPKSPAHFTERVSQLLLSCHSHHTSSPLYRIPSPFAMACPKLSLHCSVSVFLAKTPKAHAMSVKPFNRE
jgi:hypothetical protein